MRTNFILLYLLVFTLLVYSCNTKKDKQIELLAKAQSVLNTDPNLASVYLDSINNPSQMEEKHYMEYILTWANVQFLLQQEILDYSSISQAYQYYSKEGDTQKVADAAFLLGISYLDNGQFTKSFKASMESAHYAEITGDKNLGGKSFNNIGYVYFEQDVYDSAIVNYRKAIKLYTEAGSKPERMLNTFNNIGAAYDALHRSDSALFYFHKTELLADEVKNEKYKFLSSKNLGVSYYEDGQYDKAVNYLKLALDMSRSNDVLPRAQANLYLLKTYNKLHDPKSAKIYVDIIEHDIPPIKYDYTAKEMYAALSDYYRQIGNYEKAFYCAEQEILKKKQIEAENKSAELLQAEKDFYLAQQKEKNQNIRDYIYLYLIIILVAIIIIFMFMFRIYQHNRKNKEEIDKYADKYKSLKSDVLSTREECLRLNEDFVELRKMLGEKE